MSNLTYTLGVPVGNLTPAQNRPNMTINNDSNASIWNVDHYGFNNNQGGQHQKVTFPLNNVPPDPSPSPFIPTLFTKNDSFSVPQLFYYTGSTVQSSTQYYINTGGDSSALILGGIIIKFGKMGNSGPSGPTNAFTQAFPHACLSVTCNQIGATTTPGPISVSEINPGSFRAWNGSGLTITYIAIGY